MSVPGLLFAFLLTLFVIAWIVLPLLQRDKTSGAQDPLVQKQHERLLVYYERVLRNIRDLDEDHALGKIGEAQYIQAREDWAQRGVQVLKALDESGMIPETPAEDTAVDQAIDSVIESAVQRYRSRITE